MPKIHEPSPAFNRLRAAVGLIPLIEDGFNVGKIDRERASMMAEFCHWATRHGLTDDPEALRLASEIESGLQRLRTLLA